MIYPKEQALLDIVEKEVAAGNQAWVFVQMTDKRDVQDRLKQLLGVPGAHGRDHAGRSRSRSATGSTGWRSRVGRSIW